MSPRERIERVITGVLRQAFADAGTAGFHVIETGPAANRATEICRAAGGVAGRGGLSVSAASKTDLLLGGGTAADLLPFGDLYATELATLGLPVALTENVMELATRCGGPETLDAVLQRYFNRRQRWEPAARALPADVAAEIWRALEAARFRRGRTGLVPKLGARTLGIDLYA